jgi:hypothetical protein
MSLILVATRKGLIVCEKADAGWNHVRTDVRRFRSLRFMLTMVNGGPLLITDTGESSSIVRKIAVRSGRNFPAILLAKRLRMASLRSLTYTGISDAVGTAVDGQMCVCRGLGFLGQISFMRLG